MRRVLGALAAAALLASLAAAPASANGGTSLTCPGGPIAPGTYQTLTVTGMCVIQSGQIVVTDGVTVAPGATLMAISAAASLHVDGGIAVQTGGVLLLGCAPSLTDLCGPDTSYVVNDGIHAWQPLAMILHGNTIHGGVTISGGGGGVSCAPAILGGQAPAYSTIENNKISGAVMVTGLHSCWFGMARNHIAGRVTLANNVFADPDAMEILANTIHGNLACFGNDPAPKDSADNEADPTGPRIPEPNTVTGRSLGQCAAM